MANCPNPRQEHAMSTAAIPLTPKQQAFVAEYIVDKNATQAAIRAGYSAKTAQEQSSRLLSNVMVQAAIDGLLAKAVERSERSLDRWLKRLWEEADDFSELASHSARVSALKEIGKACGHYAEDNRQKAPVVGVVRLVPLTPETSSALHPDADDHER